MNFGTSIHFFRLLRLSLLLLAFGQSLGFGLEPWSRNAWYWAVKDEPILLLGGSDDDNLFQWPKEQLIPQLDRIAAAGGNVIRNTMSDRKDGGFEIYPFSKLPNGKYDLSKWNDEYWHRFETMLTETKKRNIFVQIEIWDRFDYTDVRAHDPQRWENHPYAPANNVNYTSAETGFAKRYPEHPGQNKQLFFFSTPKQRNIVAVLKYQRAFVHKMLDHALRFDHVLYCMDNETKAEPEWGEYWAKLVRKRATAAGKRVMVTEMWDDWDLKADRHRQTFDHPELYDFVDVSQNNQNSGQKHWDNFLYVRNYLSKQPRPMNTTKTYGADGNKFKHSDQDAIERFWRHLLAGAASIRFHRPDSGLGINDKAVACIRAARIVENSIPLWNVEPGNQWLDDRGQNEAYLAVTKKHDAAILYFPASKNERRIKLHLHNQPTSWRVEWTNIDTGEPAGSVLIENDLVQAPGHGNMAAVLSRIN